MENTQENIIILTGNNSLRKTNNNFEEELLYAGKRLHITITKSTKKDKKGFTIYKIREPFTFNSSKEVNFDIRVKENKEMKAIKPIFSEKNKGKQRYFFILCLLHITKEMGQAMDLSRIENNDLYVELESMKKEFFPDLPIIKRPILCPSKKQNNNILKFLNK